MAIIRGFIPIARRAFQKEGNHAISSILTMKYREKKNRRLESLRSREEARGATTTTPLFALALPADKHVMRYARVYT